MAEEGRGKAPAGSEDKSTTSVVVPPSIDASAGEPARITAVERYGGRDASRVVVLMSHPARFTVGDLAPGAGHGPRLFVDVDGARYLGKSAYAGAGIVE